MYNLDRFSILEIFWVVRNFKVVFILNAKDRKINDILFFDFYVIVLSLREKWLMIHKKASNSFTPSEGI